MAYETFITISHQLVRRTDQYGGLCVGGCEQTSPAFGESLSRQALDSFAGKLPCCGKRPR